MKRTKEKNDIIFQSECQWSFQQRVALLFFTQYEKKKNFRQIVKINKRLSEKQKHDIDYKKSYDDKTQNQHKHIAEIIVFFDVVFVL